MRVLMRVVIEDLRGAGLATGGVAGNVSVTVSGTVGLDDDAFHHAAHGDGGLRLEYSLRRLYGRVAHQAGLHAKAAVGDDGTGLRKLNRGDADLMAHGHRP